MKMATDNEFDRMILDALNYDNTLTLPPVTPPSDVAVAAVAPKNKVVEEEPMEMEHVETMATFGKRKEPPVQIIELESHRHHAPHRRRRPRSVTNHKSIVSMKSSPSAVMSRQQYNGAAASSQYICCISLILLYNGIACFIFRGFSLPVFTIAMFISTTILYVAGQHLTLSKLPHDIPPPDVNQYQESR